MFNYAVLQKAIQLVDDGIDVRHVMWELTVDNLDVSILGKDRVWYREWIIGKRGRTDDWSFAIRIETNVQGKLFTITARKAYLQSADLDRYGFHRDGAEYILDTDSPREVLSSLDRLIPYIE